jgi:hypothetical protein
MKRFALIASKHLRQRGSALLVSLMVMVGLSLLGLAFVAVSQTESAISINQRNHTQTLQVAEAATQRVVDWFQNPDWALQQQLMPNNVGSIKVTRRINSSTGVCCISGTYKDGVDDILFDKPFRPNFEDRFYGTEDNPDILLNDTTTGAGSGAPDNFLRTFNIRLFNNNTAAAAIDNSENIAITEIRIYAPPIDGSTINTEAGWTAAASGFPNNRSGFHEGGSRFGVATIRVTATKYDRPPGEAGAEIVAQRTVKATISEYPFPGPQGPIQSNANIDTNGNYKVHWGKITAEGTIELKRPFVGMNWVDAYNRVHFERGYDDVVWPANPPTPTDAANPWKDEFPWLYELIGRDYEDPWYEARARGALAQATAGQPHPYKYSDETKVPSLPICNPCNKASDAASPGQSTFFQYQDHSETPPSNFREVIFPRIDYNFWKQLAIAADDQPNIYYLQWDNPASGGKGKDYYKDRSGNVRTFEQWVNVTAAPPAGTGPKSVAGFYFFETRNNLNPQNAGGGVLAPEVTVSGGGMQMQGFVYVNADMTITGSGKTFDYYYNMPGEIYRDIGFVRVEEDASAPNYKGWANNQGSPPDTSLICDPDTQINCFVDKKATGEWEYQDLPWSRGRATKNGVFDYFVTSKTPSTPAPYNVKPTRFSAPQITNAESWWIVPYFPNCNPGVNCSEPHEPYLNFIYPNNRDDMVKVGWHDPGSATGRKAKEVDGDVPVGQTGYSVGTRVNCVAESGFTPDTDANIKTYKADRAACTSNGYDRDGGMVLIDPILDGVLYMEGNFPNAGNARFFGSILIQGSVGATGTPDVYFDEKLIKGEWPPGRFGFPRVYISSLQTD